MPPINIPRNPNEGYGQLSITGSPLSLADKTTAGVWGVIGITADVDALKGKGPPTSAGIVAYSSAVGIDAVYAESTQHAAITAVGVSETVAAIQSTNTGTTVGATAIQGNSTAGRGVAGISGTWQGVYGYSKSQAGVVGESGGFDGVFGISHDAAHAGVSGHNPGGLAGYFDGNVTVTGNVTVVGDILLPGAGDCAERFAVTGAHCDPGAVMVFDESEHLSACTEPYDRRVAGVVAGAGACRPGIVLNGAEPDTVSRPIALIGRVFCKADASYGTIEPGDLLTTSPNPGHAMKASDPSRSFGATIGKSLGSLRDGQGLIPMLVALQ